MANNAQRSIRVAWRMSVFPGAATPVDVLWLGLLGDAINDPLNPHDLGDRGGSRAPSGRWGHEQEGRARPWGRDTRAQARTTEDPVPSVAPAFSQAYTPQRWRSGEGRGGRGGEIWLRQP